MREIKVLPDEADAVDCAPEPRWPAFPPWAVDVQFLGWRRRDAEELFRFCSRPAAKAEARDRARRAIPAHHPDILF